MISIIIPTHNRRSNVELCLTGLTLQTLSPDNFEVILVDDGSTDGTIQLVELFRDKFRFKYVWLYKEDAWNASKPRNFGAKLADQKTEAFLFLDSDVVLNNQALEFYWENFQKNKERVIIGQYDWLPPQIVTPQDLRSNWDNFIKGKLSKPETFSGSLGHIGKDVRATSFEKAKSSDDTFNEIYDGLACFGGNLLIPKKIFWSVGGFSEEMMYGLEDGEMGIKLWKKDTKFSYDKRCIGYHVWHPIPPSRFPPDLRKHINYLNQKHFGQDDPDLGIIQKTKEAFARWGMENWKLPPEWEERDED